MHLILKPGRDKSLKRRHPWVFAGAIARVEGNPASGETVELRSADGEFLAVAAYSPASQIRARVWDWQPRDIDAAFFSQRITQAARARESLLGGNDTDSVRLIHGEARPEEARKLIEDGLPIAPLPFMPTRKVN